MSRISPLATAIVIGLGILLATAAPVAAEDGFTINLKSRTFSPAPRLETQAIREDALISNVSERVHFFAQFGSLPDRTERVSLGEKGLGVFEYVGGNTYVVSARLEDLDRFDTKLGLRWVGPILATDKMSSDLKDGTVGSWAYAEDGDLLLTVQVHRDVSMDEAIAIVEGLGGRVVDEIPLVRAVTAIFPAGREWDLASQDSVQYVMPVELPMGEHNDGAQTAGNVDVVQGPPYNLDGTGVTVMVYDSGIADSHVDFGARIVEFDGDASETVRDHSTHVTGTVAGDGTNSNGNDSAGNPNGGTAGQWEGMAPAANIRSFGSTGTASDFYNGLGGDLALDFTTAITNGIDLATMSLGNNVYLFNPPPCGQLGDYSLTAILIDLIVTGGINSQQLIYFESAGNERGGGAPCGQFGTISSPATAKNSIALGAINSNDNSLTGFTSLGPTDDGRIKPDLTGPGCQSNGDGGLTSPSFLDANGDGDLDPGETQNAYVVKCGTSMATPAAAGTGALLVEQWQSGHASTRPLSHTMKAMMIHAATDLGNPGPDYSFGWGAFNAQAAADLVIADETDELVHVNSVGNGGDVFYTFNSDGTSNVQVTLVWDDPAGGLLANPTLINDLDLRLIGPDDTVNMPFALDPLNPGNNATTGDDATNNVEMVIGAATGAEGTWTVRVNGDAVPAGPQQYTLITPEDAVEDNRPPNADANGPYTTDEGSDVTLDATGSTDPDGDTMTYEWDFDNDGVFDDAAGTNPDFDPVGDGVGQDGVYSVAVRVTDVNGAFDIASSTVTVNNVQPSVILGSDSPQNENSTITVNGVVSDPGWLDPLTATIDWGDGTPVENISGTLEQIRPFATLTFSVGHIYGDNGIFTATVCGFDDDTMTCETINLEILNVPPTTEIDVSSWIDGCGGESALIAHAGEELTFNGRSTDPGSDDLTLTWMWGDGSPNTTNIYLVNPPDPDPFPSPSIQPRDVTDTQTHTFGDACLFEITFSSTDDDGGSSSDSEDVVIIGNAELTRSAGFWQHQYRGKGRIHFSTEELLCYLDIVGHMSAIFNEEVDASTPDAAEDVLDPSHANGDIRVQFDRQLLAVWLNFANGAIDHDDLVDTDFDSVPDTGLLAFLCAAEAARLNPATPDTELEDLKDLLEAINLLGDISS